MFRLIGRYMLSLSLSVNNFPENACGISSSNIKASSNIYYFLEKTVAALANHSFNIECGSRENVSENDFTLLRCSL